jgi:hypothetical protein
MRPEPGQRPTPLKFGWLIPIRGDTLDYGEPQQVLPSREMFGRVVVARPDEIEASRLLHPDCDRID